MSRPYRPFRLRPETVERRFWARVEKSPTCWLWRGATVDDGYGRFMLAGRYVRAHRFSYELTHGPIPEGLDLDHLCRVRLCVRPSHLEPVTRRENLLRGETIPAHHAAKTHCVNGHAFDVANTRLTDRGWRECRACHRARELRRYHEGKAA